MDSRSKVGLILLFFAAVCYFVDRDMSVPSAAIALAGLATWYLSGGRHWLSLLTKTIWRDAKYLLFLLSCVPYLVYLKLRNITVAKRFRKVVSWAPDNVLLVNANTGAEWTRQQVEDYSNKVANYFMEKGFKKGDAVALYMPSRPEFVIHWLGLSKIGVIPALVNCNLQRAPLLHTITIVKCKAIIYGTELEQAVADIHGEIVAAMPDFQFYHSSKGSSTTLQRLGQLSDSANLDTALIGHSSKPEPKEVADSIKALDTLAYIYTSGTTGMPKAVDIKHLRQHMASVTIARLTGFPPNKVNYSVLPMYHTSGAQFGVGMGLLYGTKVVIREKFSAQNFFKDCTKHRVTSAVYLGEICRYLLSTPPSEFDKKHQVQVFVGGGLRANIWKDFMDRFNIPTIREIYGATEGNCSIANISNKVGCIGHLPLALPSFVRNIAVPLYVIRLDPMTMEPIRNSQGLCVITEPGEPGEMVGRIVKGDPLKDFSGYKDTSATSKKVLRNVLQEGDRYFRSGDILVADELGNLSFKDRAGDTFRWRSENVSTNEVEAIVNKVLNHPDLAASYGVEIPGTEGRAGMVAIPVKHEEDVDLDQFLDGVKEQLPKYARPLFLRLVKKVEMTSTFKLQKKKLREEAYDTALISDPMFFLDPRNEKYVRLDKELHNSIVSGKIRL